MPDNPAVSPRTVSRSEWIAACKVLFRREERLTPEWRIEGSAPFRTARDLKLPPPLPLG